MKKQRFDTYLFEQNYFETKSKASAAILAGNVKLNGEKVTKAGFQIIPSDNLVIEIDQMPYVSRGGFKLEKAVKEFNLDLKSKICIDAGASTGGFTDCMLQNGAKKVYAVDVGYGQLAWKLRNDSRVKVIERTNIKNCERAEIYTQEDEVATFCSMDLSFISITKVLENIKKLILFEEAEIVALIKPQFEAGKEQIGKNGVVRESATHIEVISNVISYAESINLYPKDLTFSPVKGPAGNIEYLVYLVSKSDNNFSCEKIAETVKCAYEQLS